MAPISAKVPVKDEAEVLAFDRILNFRDVGRNINQITGQPCMAKGLLYRSARLGMFMSRVSPNFRGLIDFEDDATPKDRDLLVKEYKIKSIIDLRTKSEHVKQARQRRRAGAHRPNFVRSIDDVALPLQIPGIQYFNINVNGGAFEKALLSRLTWWSYFKLIFLIIFGFRMKAISILGREVMQPRGLAGLGYDSLDYAGNELRQIIEVAADKQNYPLLVHCTQGKDRTGLAIALILFLLNIPIDAVSQDYIQSESELVPERQSRLHEIHEVGLTDDFADTPPDWIQKMNSYLESQHGGVRPYFDAMGESKKTFDKIESILLL